MSISGSLSIGPQRTWEAGVTAHAVVRSRLSELPALRQSSGSQGGRQIPPRFFQHADEQTIVGLRAVLAAIDDYGLGDTSFEAWGVLAAAQFPGRSTGALAYTKFLRRGPSSVSPHLVPQNSLHSLAGAISVALGIRGPSFGVGGGPQAFADALFAAATFTGGWLQPGLWLVVTQWDHDAALDPNGVAQEADPTCHAVALALSTPRPNGPRLQIATRLAGEEAPRAHSQRAAPGELSSVADLAERLSAPIARGWSSPWTCRSASGFSLTVTFSNAQSKAKAA